MNRYQKYLQSDEWRAVRARILKRARGKCESCGKRPPIQVHHKTYARLGRERDDDLLAVCGPCHQKMHPDKVFLSPSFVGEADCPMCPSETAEIFAGSFEVLTICTGCGHTATKPRQGVKPATVDRMPRKHPKKRQKSKAEAKPVDPWAKERAHEKQRERAAIESGRKKLAEGKPKPPKRSAWAFSR